MKKIIILLSMVLLFPVLVNAEEINMNYQKVFEFSKPEGYSGIQGMIVTDKYFVIAVINSNNKDSALLVYDKVTYKSVKSAPIVIQEIGHANDFAYDEKNDEIMIVEGSKIYVLDGKEFNLKRSIDLPKEFMAIDFDENYYYLRDNNTLFTYDKSFNKVNEFNVSTTSARQGISKKGNYIYYSLFDLNSDGTLGTSYVKVFNLNGEVVNSLNFGSELGEIEAFEFDKEIPYILFWTYDMNGAIYTPKYEDISESLLVKDETSGENNQAGLFDEAGNIEVAKLKDGYYTFQPITYTEPGKYEYYIKKIGDGIQPISENDVENTINVTVNVVYDASVNKLKAISEYEKEGFKEKNDNNQDVIDTPINPGQSSNGTTRRAWST